MGRRRPPSLTLPRFAGEGFPGGRRLIDISVALKEGIKSDPPHSLPKIEYMDHHMTAPAMAEYMGDSSTRSSDTAHQDACRC